METIWTEAGLSSFQALRDLVVRLRGGDPLAPVAVVTPTPAAAVGLRRALARECGGLAAVSFQSLDGLAELLAAPAIAASGDFPSGDREVLIAAVRVQLAADPGRFEGIEGHRSTWEALAGAVEELASVPADARHRLAEAGGLAAEVARLHDAVAATTTIGGRAAVLRAAAHRVTGNASVLAAIGPVVLHAPGRLDVPSLELVRAIAVAGRLHVVAEVTGDERADAPVVAPVVALGGAEPAGGGVPPAPSRVISANDIDDELRAAVRFVLSRAEHGVPLTSMAVVHPHGEPYTRAVAELLRSAGIPFSGPGGETLAQSAPGRVLLGLLDVIGSGFTRQAVVDLWAGGVVVGSAGAPVPSVALDERTRRLGIVGGRAAWHERIAGRRVWLDRNPVDTSAPADVVEGRLRRRADELADLVLVEELLATIERLVDDLPRTWSALAAWVADCLDTLCGPVARRSGWPAHELEADTAIRTAVARLGALEQVEPAPTSDVVTGTLRAILDAPAPRRSRSGTGLLVTTLSQPPSLPLDTVVVVGMAEGFVPRPVREDVLLGDPARAAAGLPVGDDAAAEQRRHLLLALGAGGAERVLTYARSEQRSGRTMVPSRWLLDSLERLTGHRPRTEALIAGHDVAGVEVVPSHRAGIDAVASGARPALHDVELRLAALAAADDFDAHPASHDDVVAAGATLARSRAADAFTRFDGNVGDGVDILAEGRNLSPTSIETYATCPRRWFLGHALGVGDVDRPEEVERLQARDKGSLAHTVLERFVGEAIEAGRVPDPGESWGPAGQERLLEIAEEEFADFERRGLTGHPRWWAHDRQEITRVLLETLRRDDDIRAEHRSRPVAVELTFGRDDQPPLEVVLDDGRTVLLAGSADRVDEVPGGVMVHDYKFGSPSPYGEVARRLDDGGDPLAGGRRLQLLTYAEAAAQQRGVEPGSAWYWFLKPGYTGKRIGYEIGPEHRQLFRETLRVLVDGIGAGLFPARSGEFDWWFGTNKHCGWCDFDAICPADREDEWDRSRSHPALADVGRLAEHGAPAFLVTAPVDGPEDGAP